MGYSAKHMDGRRYWHADMPEDGLDQRCGGTGYLNCYCGGDLCICGNFGEVECLGCPDCKYEFEDREEEDYDEITRENNA